MKTYLEQLAEGIRAVHGCHSLHIATTPVTEIFRGKVAWQGQVETFFLHGHPKAKRCYAWGYPDEKREDNLTVVAVLEIPPVLSPELAVKTAIAAEAGARWSGGGTCVMRTAEGKIAFIFYRNYEPTRYEMDPEEAESLALRLIHALPVGRENDIHQKVSDAVARRGGFFFP